MKEHRWKDDTGDQYAVSADYAECVDIGSRMITPLAVPSAVRAEQFLRRSMTPLGQVKEFLHESQARMFVDEFGNECEGMCGT